METNSENAPVQGNQSRNIWIIAIIVALCIPFAFSSSIRLVAMRFVGVTESNTLVWHKWLAALGAGGLLVFALCLDRLCKNVTLQLSSVIIKKVTFIYLAIPVIIFLLGWLKFWFSLPLTALIGYALFRFCKTFNDPDDAFCQLKLTNLIIPLAIVFLWVWYSGVGGYTIQTLDHYLRNDVFHDLINYKWPVVYDIDGGLGFVYYMLIWMFPSLIGKALGWEAANFALYLWVAGGVILSFLLVSLFVKASSKKQLLAVIAILVCWSGLQLLAQPIRNIFNLGNTEPNFIQYRPNNRILQWVFNAGVPTWVCCSLLMNIRKHTGLLAFTAFFQFAYAPLPFLGVLPVYAGFLIEALSPNIKNLNIKYITKQLFTLQNISGIILAAIFALYYASGSGGEMVLGFGIPLGAYLENSNFIKLLIFEIVEFGVFMCIIYDKDKKYWLFYVIGIVLAIIPFLKDSMSSSMGALFLLMTLYIDYLFTCDKNKWRYTIAVVLLALCVYQKYGVITTYIKSMHDSKVFPIVLDDKTLVNPKAFWKTHINQYFLDQYISKDLEGVFFKVIAKRNKNVPLLDADVADYQFALDMRGGRGFFQSNGGVFYSQEKRRVNVTPTKPFELGKQFGIQILLNPAGKQVVFSNIISSQNKDGTDAWRIEQDGGTLNQYVLLGGYQNKEIRSTPFRLNKNEWNYIALNFDSQETKKASLYVNGDLVAEAELPVSYAPANDEFVIGNWHWGDRAFNGVIKEVSIKNELISPNVIHSTWKKLSTASITTINDIYHYLRFIHNPRYSILIAVKDEAAVNINDNIEGSLSKLGLKKSLKGQIQHSYLAVIDKGVVVYEELAPDNKTFLSYTGTLQDGLQYNIVSASLPSGNKCSIVLNDSDYAVNWRGLNFVVYDNETQQVIDSVAFDTWSKGLEAHRK